MPTTGSDLRAARARALIDQQDIAARLGRARQTVAKWERQEIVSPEAAREYLQALTELVDAREAASPTAETQVA